MKTSIIGEVLLLMTENKYDIFIESNESEALLHNVEPTASSSQYKLISETIARCVGIIEELWDEVPSITIMPNRWATKLR